MKNENEKLLNYININTNKSYDIIFCGGLSPRRTKIINSLIEKKYSVNVINGLWNDERDKVISNAKILLNIHVNDDYNIYESIRCDRWIYSGMLIITENSINDNENDMNNLLIIVDYDNLINKVIEVLNNYDEYYNNYLKIHNKELSQIIVNRNITCDNFITYIETI